MKTRTINKLILHCSDTPDGRDIGLVEINEWHRDRNFPLSVFGFYVGYHYILRLDGIVEVARPDFERGAHCTGHNFDSIGICLVGRGNYTKDQWKSLYILLENLMITYGLEPKHVFGHKEFSSKTCPNIADMEQFRDELELKFKGGTNGTKRFS